MEADFSINETTAWTRIKAGEPPESAWTRPPRVPRWAWDLKIAHGGTLKQALQEEIRYAEEHIISREETCRRLGTGPNSFKRVLKRCGLEWPPSIRHRLLSGQASDRNRERAEPPPPWAKVAPRVARARLRRGWSVKAAWQCPSWTPEWVWEVEQRIGTPMAEEVLRLRKTMKRKEVVEHLGLPSLKKLDNYMRNRR